ncbi:immunity 49 family protein [Nocardia salmonicida]|uniref:immunity 49 family protein n=1 Tax=Nocardia salmonicida TaxID=53431 RepID=UPI0033F77A93
MIIERPDIDQAFIENRILVLDKQVREWSRDAPGNIRAANDLPALTLTRLLHLLAFKPQDWIVAEKAAVDVLDAYESLMHLVSVSPRDERDYMVTRTGSHGNRSQSNRREFRVTMTPADFFNAFWIAVILGDTRRLNLLVQIPVEYFIAPNVEADEFLYKWMEALQCLQGGDARWAQLFGDAIWLSHPQRAPIADSDSLHYLLYPPIKLFHTLVTGTEEQFNLDLEDALVRHDYYWRSESERKLDPEGWVSLPLTAIACMALSKGYTVVPESGYLPLALGLEKG